MVHHLRHLRWRIPLRYLFSAMPYQVRECRGAPSSLPDVQVGGCRLMETLAFQNVRTANRPLKKFALMSASGLSGMRLRENVCRQRRLPMNRFPIVFSSIALVALAGCATESVISSATVPGQAVGAA